MFLCGFIYSFVSSYINQIQIEHIICVKHILGLRIWQETIMVLPLTKLILRGEICTSHTPSHIPDSIFFVVLLLTFANLLIFSSLLFKGRLNAQYSSTIIRDALLFVAQVCSDICIQGWIHCWKLCSQWLWSYKIKGRIVNYACVIMGSISSLLILHKEVITSGLYVPADSLVQSGWNGVEMGCLKA